MRLDKALGLAGMTRDEAKKCVRAGRVTVKGQTAKDPGQKAETDWICLDGRPLQAPETVTLMLNKPAGIVTATEDPRWQTVVDLLPERLRKRALGPVGRLDRDVTGLVLLTDDGTMAHRLISPKWKAGKVYLARCEGRLGEEEREAFARGIVLSDFTCQPAQLEILEAGEGESLARVTLREGKFHQVKRMFQALGHPLKALKREAIGGVTLDPALEEGQWRMLTREEEARLRESVGM